MLICKKKRRLLLGLNGTQIHIQDTLNTAYEEGLMSYRLGVYFEHLL